MRKLGFLFIIVLAISSQLVQAQTKAYRFGFSIAPTVSWLSPSTEGYESGGSDFGFSWGFLSDFALTDNYFISTGVGMDFMGGNLNFQENYEYTSKDVPNTTLTANGASVERNLSTKYLTLPVLMKMKTNQFGKLSYFGQFGTEFGIRLSAKASDRVLPIEAGAKAFDYTKDLVEEKEVNFAKLSLIFAGGVEYSIDESTSLIGGLKYNNGLTDILRGDNNITQKERNAMLYNFQFTIGVMF